MPDAKVKKAIEEIQAVLEKYDLPGVAFVGGRNHTHHLYQVEASWTCLRMEGYHLRIRSRTDTKSLRAKKEQARASVGVLVSFITACQVTSTKLEALVANIAQRFKISHLDILEQARKR